MKLIFSDNDKETSSGFVKEENMIGGNPILKDMAVPAGLFFLQQAFDNKTPNYNIEENTEVVSESLYERLLGLVGDSSKRKTRKNSSSGKKQRRKTKKNN